jgi:2-iminoacetate synthase ThiH
VELTPVQLEEMLERAAQKGAKEALHSIGLHDDKSADDVRELRSLLQMFRQMKTTAINTFVRALVMAILGLIMIGFYVKYGKIP